MKNKKFKTLKLAIIFVIIIFIIVLGIKYVSKMMKEKEYNDIKTNMLIIQGKIKLLKGESEINKNNEIYKGTQVSQSENQDIKKFLQDIGIEESKFENYYILSNKDFEELGILGELKNVEDNIYIVSYNDSEVIYLYGININNVTKYKLSDIIVKKQKKIWILYNRLEE